MRTPRDIIGDDAVTQLAFEGYAVVPIKPTKEMVASGSLAMPVEYEYASMKSDGVPDHSDPQHRGRAVRMTVTSWTKEPVDPATVWSAMISKVK